MIGVDFQSLLEIATIGLDNFNFSFSCIFQVILSEDAPFMYSTVP